MVDAINQDLKQYLRKNDMVFKEKHYTRWQAEIYLLNIDLLLEICRAVAFMTISEEEH